MKGLVKIISVISSRVIKRDLEWYSYCRVEQLSIAFHGTVSELNVLMTVQMVKHEIQFPSYWWSSHRPQLIILDLTIIWDTWGRKINDHTIFAESVGLKHGDKIIDNNKWEEQDPDCYTLNNKLKFLVLWTFVEISATNIEHVHHKLLNTKRITKLIPILDFMVICNHKQTNCFFHRRNLKPKHQTKAFDRTTIRKSFTLAWAFEVKRWNPAKE